MLEVSRKLIMCPLPNEFASRREPGESKLVEDEKISIRQCLEIDMMEPAGVVFPT
jgi:hypothetical protein